MMNHPVCARIRREMEGLETRGMTVGQHAKHQRLHTDLILCQIAAVLDS